MHKKTVTHAAYFVIFEIRYSWNTTVRGEIDQISTNTFQYSTCCTANVYIFVYIFIEAPIVPLNYCLSSCNNETKSRHFTHVRDMYYETLP